MQKIITYENGFYFGDVKNEQPHGRGTMNYMINDELTDGTYEGEWKHS